MYVLTHFYNDFFQKYPNIKDVSVSIPLENLVSELKSNTNQIDQNDINSSKQVWYMNGLDGSKLIRNSICGSIVPSKRQILHKIILNTSDHDGSLQDF